jgi:hypothetical protein
MTSLRNEIPIGMIRFWQGHFVIILMAVFKSSRNIDYKSKPMTNVCRRTRDPPNTLLL